MSSRGSTRIGPPAGRLESAWRHDSGAARRRPAEIPAREGAVHEAAVVPRWGRRSWSRTSSAPIEITHLVRRGIRLQGSYGARVRGDMPEIVALAAAGRISVTQPISRRYRLDQADEAYRALDRGEITGRAIVVVD